VVGKDYLSTIADKQVAVDFYSSIPEPGNFLEESDRVEHDAIANYATAILTEDAARNQLQYETLPINDYSVPGVVPPGITCHDGKSFRKHVDDLALAFVSPLRADYDRSLACLQMFTPSIRFVSKPLESAHTPALRRNVRSGICRVEVY